MTSFSATDPGSEGTMGDKSTFPQLIGQQGGLIRVSRAISLARKGAMCEYQKAGIQEEGRLQCWRGLPGKVDSASLLQSSRKYCWPCQQAGHAAEGVSAREGPYLPRAVVQIHQDI